MKYVIRGEYLKFIIWTLVAATFHKSALILIPIYLGAKWLSTTTLKKYHYILGGLFVLTLIFGQDIYRTIIFIFYPYYENSMFDTINYSYTNIGKCLGTLLLSCICYKTAISDNCKNKFYFYLTMGGFVLYTAGAFIPEVSRIAYYFIISQIFFIPNLILSMKKGFWKYFFSISIIIAFIAHFILFLITAYQTDIRLLPYLNWIFN